MCPTNNIPTERNNSIFVYLYENKRYFSLLFLELHLVCLLNVPRLKCSIQ